MAAASAVRAWRREIAIVRFLHIFGLLSPGASAAVNQNRLLSIDPV
jgi:hypothetical protein